VLEVVIEGATGDAGDGFVPVLCCIWFAESPDNDGAFFENESDLSLPIISDNDSNDCLTATLLPIFSSPLDRRDSGGV